MHLRQEARAGVGVGGWEGGEHSRRKACLHRDKENLTDSHHQESGAGTQNWQGGSAGTSTWCTNLTT